MLAKIISWSMKVLNWEIYKYSGLLLWIPNGGIH